MRLKPGSIGRLGARSSLSCTNGKGSTNVLEYFNSWQLQIPTQQMILQHIFSLDSLVYEVAEYYITVKI